LLKTCLAPRVAPVWRGPSNANGPEGPGKKIGQELEPHRRVSFDIRPLCIVAGVSALRRSPPRLPPSLVGILQGPVSTDLGRSTHQPPQHQHQIHPPLHPSLCEGWMASRPWPCFLSGLGLVCSVVSISSSSMIGKFSSISVHCIISMISV